MFMVWDCSVPIKENSSTARPFSWESRFAKGSQFRFLVGWARQGMVPSSWLLEFALITFSKSSPTSFLRVSQHVPEGFLPGSGFVKVFPRCFVLGRGTERNPHIFQPKTDQLPIMWEEGVFW